jgi:hypothetical protein
VKRVWFDVTKNYVAIRDSYDNDLIIGYTGDIDWALEQAYKYAENWNWKVTHEQRGLEFQ